MDTLNVVSFDPVNARNFYGYITVPSLNSPAFARFASRVGQISQNVLSDPKVQQFAEVKYNKTKIPYPMVTVSPAVKTAGALHKHNNIGFVIGTRFFDPAFYINCKDKNLTAATMIIGASIHESLHVLSMQTILEMLNLSDRKTKLKGNYKKIVTTVLQFGEDYFIDMFSVRHNVYGNGFIIDISKLMFDEERFQKKFEHRNQSIEAYIDYMIGMKNNENWLKYSYALDEKLFDYCNRLKTKDMYVKERVELFYDIADRLVEIFEQPKEEQEDKKQSKQSISSEEQGGSGEENNETTEDKESGDEADSSDNNDNEKANNDKSGEENNSDEEESKGEENDSTKDSNDKGDSGTEKDNSESNESDDNDATGEDEADEDYLPSELIDSQNFDDIYRIDSVYLDANSNNNNENIIVEFQTIIKKNFYSENLRVPFVITKNILLGIDRIEENHFYDYLGVVLSRIMGYTNREIPSHPYYSGSKILKNQIHRIITDNKFLGEYSPEEIEENRLKVVLLCDVSGSTSRTVIYKNKSVPLYQVITQAGTSSLLSLKRAGIEGVLLFHTSIYELGNVDTPVVYRVATTDFTEEDILRAGAAALKIRKGNNYDGFAIEKASNEFVGTEPNCKKLLIHMSDGFPNGLGYEGDVSVDHTSKVVDSLNSDGIMTYSMSLVKEVVIPNNLIYGVRNIDVSSGNIDIELGNLILEKILQK